MAGSFWILGQRLTHVVGTYTYIQLNMHNKSQTHTNRTLGSSLGLTFCLGTLNHHIIPKTEVAIIVLGCQVALLQMAAHLASHPLGMELPLLLGCSTWRKWVEVKGSTQSKLVDSI